jgi:flagellar hook assembly protein FlgD
VYNMLGQEVVTLVDQDRDAGFHQVDWDGRSSSGNSVSSGIYFYKLEADSFVQTKKMMLLK